jgi:hypothetical protein
MQKIPVILAAEALARSMQLSGETQMVNGKEYYVTHNGKAGIRFNYKASRYETFGV